MNYKEAFDKLEILGQTHLLKYWDKLASDEQFKLLSQIQNIHMDTFFYQQEIVDHPALDYSKTTFEPFLDFHGSGVAADEKLGKEAISQGKMGCLIVAGGQGTRLRLNGPKGLFPISNIKKKSLFQIFAEKTLAASKQSAKYLPLAIMTSPLNHEITQLYFDTHLLFGLSPSQLDFFPQKMLPFLDVDKNLFLEKPDSIAQGPDGNGSSLYNFYQSGLLKKWKEEGVEYLNFVLIDNPLADPFDAELLGFHIRNQNDITIKCTLKNHPEEKVGVIVKQNDQVKVIEYSEMSEEERNAKAKDASLKHSCANLSLFCISLSYIEKICQRKDEMTLHTAYKLAPSINNPEHMAWKFERFIFDILSGTNKVQALYYPRETCFAPLKNIQGNDSPETVQKALLKSDQLIYEKIFGVSAPDKVIELSQDFYYPTPSYIHQWKEKPFANDGYLGEI